MKKVLKVVGWILLILLTAAAVAWFGFLKPKPPPISPEDQAEITLMPLPAEMRLGKGVFVLDEDLSHQFQGLSTPRMERAISRFYKKLTQETGISLGEGDKRVLILECSGDAMEYPSFGDNESYSIKISSTKIVLKASSETGILYGLESLLQLVREENGAWVIPQLILKDQPRYPWRGLMIDACRHWIPKEVILRNLDAMAALKMNIFHWHLSESQAFRVESKLFPKLHEMGSGGDYYSQSDIREVVEYAADRGIRVVPEFDMPGHTTAWFVGHPELASGPGPYSLDTVMIGHRPAMDPTREEVYDFLDQFFGEMTGLFPDNYLHIGGDEVNPTQWKKNPQIQDYMKEHELEDTHALQAHFNVRLQKIVASHGKIMLGWDEILHPDLPGEGIAVQTWRDHGSLWESARLGNQAILSAGYYLDHKQSASYHYGVDPSVIPGAVEIEVDSANWKGWDCQLKVAEMLMDGALYFFGEGDELRGIMDFMGGTAGITEVTLEGNSLVFIVETSMGDMKFETEILGDSISGLANLTPFKLELTGSRNGGTDMAGGLPLPEFKKITPLTPEDELFLLGGEACMWTEMADGFTIESRIWPRAAAIGEKLWSPKVLTDDVQDMYRRLMVVDDRLEELGLMHRSYSRTLTDEMVEEQLQEPLYTLVQVLQEDRLFNRMSIYDQEYNLRIPLNRVVDAALAESLVAYRFAQDVDLWIESGDTEALKRLNTLLETWSANHKKLAPAMGDFERLKEVEAHSIHLSELANLGLQAISDPASLEGRLTEISDLFSSASEAHGGTIMLLVEPVKKLVESAAKN